MTEPIFTYLVIAEDGTSHEHHHRMTGTDSIATVVRAGLDGWPEDIRVGDPALVLWCDEDGRPRRRPVNPAGSRLVLLLGGRPGEPHRRAGRAAPGRPAPVPKLTTLDHHPVGG